MKKFLLVLACMGSVPLLVIALNFPYHYDRPLTPEETEAARRYYADAYAKPAVETPTESESAYLRIAIKAAEDNKIEEQIRAFVGEYKLKDQRVLEVGSGRGYLQDVVANYTGLDISSSVARFYHKKFVLGSATAMPFPDNSFDGLWSVLVFEHVPNPEQAFLEARRVTRDGGVLFLLPAWSVPTWVAEGYPVRPYSDFGIMGKITKASIPLRYSPVFRALMLLPVRAIRERTTTGPTRLRYRRLTPNYEKYWMADSDAVISIDSHEAMLWFISRGDECLNCGQDGLFFPLSHVPLIIRVRKPDAAPLP